MDNLNGEDADLEEPVPRVQQIGVGLFLAFLSIICLLGSIQFLYRQISVWDISSTLAGVLILALCIIAVAKARLLLIGKKIDGGLFTPFGLRVSSLLFLGLAVFMVIVTVSEDRIEQTVPSVVFCFGIFLGLNSLASRRMRQIHKNEELTRNND